MEYISILTSPLDWPQKTTPKAYITVQNPCTGSKDMINFMKFSTKYLTALLTLDLRWSCPIKDYSSR